MSFPGIDAGWWRGSSSCLPLACKALSCKRQRTCSLLWTSMQSLRPATVVTIEKLSHHGGSKKARDDLKLPEVPKTKWEWLTVQFPAVQSSLYLMGKNQSSGHASPMFPLFQIYFKKIVNFQLYFNLLATTGKVRRHYGGFACKHVSPFIQHKRIWDLPYVCLKLWSLVSSMKGSFDYWIN